MAKIKRDYELKPRGRPAKHPLDEWVEKVKDATEKWVKKGRKGKQPGLSLIKGQDYEAETETIRQAIWTYRRENEIPLAVRSISDNEILILYLLEE